MLYYDLSFINTGNSDIKSVGNLVNVCHREFRAKKLSIDTS